MITRGQPATIALNGGVAVLSVGGQGGLAIQITGTWVGTLIFEACGDGLTNAATGALTNPITLNAVALNGSAIVTGATAVGLWIASISGLTHVQVRATAWTSGSAIISLNAAPSVAGALGLATIPDGGDANAGSTTDAKVVGDTSGTMSAKLRGLNYLINLVTDTLNQWVKVSIQNATLAVTQSGTWNLVVNGWTAGVYALCRRAGYENAIWTTSHAPTSNTQATITRATAGGSTKNVCIGLTVTLAATSTAPTAVNLSVALIDGGSGGTTYLWRTTISLPAVAGAISAFTRSNLWLPGSANTQMTLEFSVAGGANTIESVSLEGTTTT